MTLLIVLCCLAAERLLVEHEDLRDPFWFPGYRRRIAGLPLPPSLRRGIGPLACLWLPPLVVIGLLQWILGDAWLGIPGALFSALVLYASLGPRELLIQTDLLLSALERQDAKETHDRTWELLGARSPASAQQLADAVVSTLVVEANRRSFAVLFWFLVLGPLGAAGYRMAWLVRGQVGAAGDLAPSAADATRLVAVLDWLPARATAIAYALAGNFDQAVRAWRAHPYEFPQDSGPLLIDVGKAALREGPQEDAAAASERETARIIARGASLIWRAMLIWIALLALITLAGWA